MLFHLTVLFEVNLSDLQSEVDLGRLGHLQSLYPQFIPLSKCPCDTIKNKCQVECCCDPVSHYIYVLFF